MRRQMSAPCLGQTFPEGWRPWLMEKQTAAVEAADTEAVAEAPTAGTEADVQLPGGSQPPKTVTKTNSTSQLPGSAADNRPPADQPTTQSLYEAALDYSALELPRKATDEQIAKRAEAKAALQALVAQLGSSLEGKAVYDAAVKMCGQCRCGQKNPSTGRKHESTEAIRQILLRGSFNHNDRTKKLKKIAAKCEWQNNSVTNGLMGALSKERREEWATLEAEAKALRQVKWKAAAPAREAQALAKEKAKQQAELEGKERENKAWLESHQQGFSTVKGAIEMVLGGDSDQARETMGGSGIDLIERFASQMVQYERCCEFADHFLLSGMDEATKHCWPGFFEWLEVKLVNFDSWTIHEHPGLAELKKEVREHWKSMETTEVTLCQKIAILIKLREIHPRNDCFDASNDVSSVHKQPKDFWPGCFTELNKIHPDYQVQCREREKAMRLANPSHRFDRVSIQAKIKYYMGWIENTAEAKFDEWSEEGGKLREEAEQADTAKGEEEYRAGVEKLYDAIKSTRTDIFKHTIEPELVFYEKAEDGDGMWAVKMTLKSQHQAGIDPALYETLPGVTVQDGKSVEWQFEAPFDVMRPMSLQLKPLEECYAPAGSTVDPVIAQYAAKMFAPFAEDNKRCLEAHRNLIPGYVIGGSIQGVNSRSVKSDAKQFKLFLDKQLLVNYPTNAETSYFDWAAEQCEKFQRETGIYFNQELLDEAKETFEQGQDQSRKRKFTGYIGNNKCRKHQFQEAAKLVKRKRVADGDSEEEHGAHGSPMYNAEHAFVRKLDLSGGHE